jgi:glycosyltransferase involved in cell wall biosynthesis
MKIAIISKADSSGGGASRVAEELCKLLQGKGHKADHFVSVKSPDATKVHSMFSSFYVARIARRLNHYVKKAGFPELIPWELPFLLAQRVVEYDLIHFHDISGAISPFTVHFLAERRPTCWTFHDCSPFTGGCLYPLSCERFKQSCGSCPQLGNWPIDTQFDFTGFLRNIKRKTAQSRWLVPVAPSLWMAKLAKQSGLYPQLPVVIPNGVDTNTFAPSDRPSIRRQLDLPVDRFIVLLVSAYVGESRKGVQFAVAALEETRSVRPHILVIGNLDTETRTALNQFETTETGYLADVQQKSAYFSAADVCLFTSLADNMPLTILETMACGIPTVGFATGGVPEMIDHELSGYLVAPKDVNGLSYGLQLALQDGRAVHWGKKARERVQTDYTHQVFLENHLQLYRETIAKFNQ